MAMKTRTINGLQYDPFTYMQFILTIDIKLLSLPVIAEEFNSNLEYYVGHYDSGFFYDKMQHYD